MSKDELLAYMRFHRLAVVATSGPEDGPQAALVGIGVTDVAAVVFDTLSTTRKHSNLERNNRAAVTFSGPGEKTLQFEGRAFRVMPSEPGDRQYLEAYYAAWPDGRDRAGWPNLVYWRIAPRWARYSDYDRGPLIVEFHWEEAGSLRPCGPIHALSSGRQVSEASEIF
ncbi:MAG: pyridoxamine 5'-phosphate oxidase family protein [Candidatus Eremiobacteraeota bacterium]|nr:pyridoxamine 5'-phosphate oxidase family protein [Candidatus Eremiobacteraeota bacterium]